MPIRPLLTAVVGMLAAALLLLYGNRNLAEPMLIGAGIVALSAICLLFVRKPRLRRIAASALAVCIGIAVMTAVVLCFERKISAAEMRYVGEGKTYAVEICSLQRYENSVLAEVELEDSGVLASVWCYGEIRKELCVGDRLTAKLTLKAARTDETYGLRLLADGIFLTGTMENPEWTAHAVKTLANLPERSREVLLTKMDEVFGEASPILRALLLGDRSAMDSELGELASDTGITHVFAVSGMHLTFFIGLLLLFSRGRRKNFVIAAAVSLTFAALTGFSPSIVRAAVMQIALFSAALFGRRNDSLTALSAALAVLLLQNPYAVCDVGLQLSFAAVLGLLIFSPRAAKRLRSICDRLPWIAGKPLEFFGTTLVMTACAQIFTFPLLAVHMGYISLVSALTNTLAYWVVALLFVLGWGVLGLSAVWMSAALVLAVPLLWLTSALEAIVRTVAEIPFAVLGTDHWLVCAWILATSGLIAFVLLRPKLIHFLWASAAAVLGLVAVLTGIYRQAAQTMEIVALDVGYGRCIVITCGEDTVVVDCGSTRSGAGKALRQHLKTRNIDDIDLLIVSVNKPHHTSGIAELLPITRRMAFSAEFGDRTVVEAIDTAAIAAKTEILPLTDGKIALDALEIELFVPPAMAADASAATVVRSVYGSVTVLSDHTEISLHRLMQNEDFGESDVLVCADHAIKFRMQREIVMKMQAEYVIICSNDVADTPEGVCNTARDGTLRLCLTE